LIEIGRSVQNQPIEATRFGYGSKVIVFIGGLHAGFAPATVQIAEETAVFFTENLTTIPADITIYVNRSANPDSPSGPAHEGELCGRLNANQVDLNRNWDCRWTKDAQFRGNVVRGSGGSAPFSEPETQTLRDFLQGVMPTAVVFWEARYIDGFVSPGRCTGRSDVSYGLAQVYGDAAGYQVDDFEIDTQQILNGDGTNWLDSVGIAATAVLLPDYDDMDWNNNLNGVLAVIQAIHE
jgi:hypothetical protein